MTSTAEQHIVIFSSYHLPYLILWTFFWFPTFLKFPQIFTPSTWNISLIFFDFFFCTWVQNTSIFCRIFLSVTFKSLYRTKLKKKSSKFFKQLFSTLKKTPSLYLFFLYLLFLFMNNFSKSSITFIVQF